jgi:hypothetical protein
LLLLDRTHAKDQPRDAVGAVDLQDAFGEPNRFVDLAVGQHGEEGAAEQLVVAGVAAQRGAVIGSGGGGVALATGVAGGEIAAGGGGTREVRGRLRLRGEQSRASDSEYGQCGQRRTPTAWRRDHGSSTPSGGRSPVARPR